MTSRHYGRKNPRGFSCFSSKKIFNSKYFFSELTAQKVLSKFKRKYKYFSLEIGFGLGENVIFLSKRAKLSEGIIGCDPYLSGHLKLVNYINSTDVSNITFTNLDFFSLYGFIKKLSFTNIYVLFPDPWPKKRHAKRRIINESNLKKLSLLLRPNGRITLATDDEKYFEVIKKIFFSNFEFQPCPSCFISDDPSKLSVSKTKYFLKAKKNSRKPNYISFIKKKVI